MGIADSRQLLPPIVVTVWVLASVIAIAAAAGLGRVGGEHRWRSLWTWTCYLLAGTVVGWSPIIAMRLGVDMAPAALGLGVTAVVATVASIVYCSRVLYPPTPRGRAHIALQADPERRGALAAAYQQVQDRQHAEQRAFLARVRREEEELRARHGVSARAAVRPGHPASLELEHMMQEHARAADALLRRHDEERESFAALRG